MSRGEKDARQAALEKMPNALRHSEKRQVKQKTIPCANPAEDNRTALVTAQLIGLHADCLVPVR